MFFDKFDFVPKQMGLIRGSDIVKISTRNELQNNQ